MPAKKKMVMIGIDGANYGGMRQLLETGRLPNLRNLIRGGVLCENALSSYPTLTGSNWATIATGAWPGTHGVTDMSYHVTGEPIDYWHSGFTSEAIEAETIWEAAVRQGKKAIVLKYPGAGPVRDNRVIMVDGGSGRPFWGGSFLEISHSQLFSTLPLPNSQPLKLRPAKDWKNSPKSSRPPLAAEFNLVGESGNVPDELHFKGLKTRHTDPIKLHLLLVAGNEGYNTLYLCLGKDVSAALCVLQNNQWSPTMIWDFRVGKKTLRGGVRIKAQQVDPSSGDVMLYFAQIYPVDTFTHPGDIGTQLVARFGAHVNHPGFSEFAMGWFDDESFFELMDYQNQWLASAACYLTEKYAWDLFAMQTHCIDFAAHAWMPRRGWTKEQCVKGLEKMARCYESVDRMVGKILSAVGDNVFVCVVSDHGETPTPGREVFVNPILAEAGLLTFEEGAASSDRLRVDWQKTQAVSQRCSFIYLNLAGREPEGIVPLEKYKQVRQRVIDALMAYREPESGENPFAMILCKEDAYMLGIFDSLGRDIGDVVYALRPEFDHEHGRQLPAATLDGHTIKPLLVFRGPGVKKGLILKRPVWLVDVAPTVCAATGLFLPSESEGAVLRQIFTDHKTIFPRQKMLKKQRERMLEFASRTEKPSLSAKQDFHAPAEAEEKTPAEEPIPETVPELQAALKMARQEAKHWKDSYNKYHRITHGN